MAPRGSRSRVPFAIAVAFGVVACRQIVGIHDEPAGRAEPGVDAALDSSTDAGACSPPPNADTCQTCLAGSCCSQLAACNAETSCKHSLDCMLGCASTDESCRAACVVGFDTALAEVTACRASACAVPCDLSCGGILGEVLPDIVAASPTCAQCVSQNVCNELSACATDPSCVRFTACPTRACTYLDRACFSACRFPVGVAGSRASNALFNAIHTRCTAECRQGTDWDCVGKLTWSIAQAGTLTFDMSFLDALTRKPYVGAQVRSCPPVGPSCDAPYDTSSTDANGHVRVTAQVLGGIPFNGYFDVTGANAFPTLHFVFPGFAGSLVGDATYSTELDVLSMQDFSLAATGAPFAVDVVSHGTMTLIVQDCLRVPGSGLVFDVAPSDSTTMVIYPRNGQYDPNSMSTDVTGLAFVLNAPAGGVKITARVATTNAVVSSASVFVRAGANSALAMAPLPAQ